MKKIILVVLTISYVTLGKAQQKVQDTLDDFDLVHFKEHLSEMKNNSARENYTNTVQRDFIKRKYDLVKETEHLSAASTSTCGNLDFEDGNINGWTTTGDFQIMSGTGLDPFGGFPVVCPGGNFSLRLNDNNTACSGPTPKVNFASTATNTMNITPMYTNVKVDFAACLLDFPHPQSAAGFFKIEFYDQSNNLITVPTFSACYANPPGTVIATMPATNYATTIQGAQICSTVSTYPVQYFPWQTIYFNLSSYIGQTVSIKLVANWCLYNYDWAYAYFDVCCDGACPNKVTDVKIEEKDNVSLYPNPVKNELVIDTKNNPEISEFVMYNCLGQEVLRKQISIGKNLINTSELTDGLYFYSLVSNNKPVKQGKLVKD